MVPLRINIYHTIPSSASQYHVHIDNLLQRHLGAQEIDFQNQKNAEGYQTEYSQTVHHAK